MHHLTPIKWLLLSIVFLSSSITLLAQINAPVQVDVFPPAPTAASLGKFAETPVSLYKGLPQINIPIWELKEGNIKVPISLNYNAGGVQLQQIASWVGLGFALQAGGAITRTVRGRPDDLANGYLDPTYRIPPAYSYDYYNQFNDYSNGKLDSQPDQFTFSFGNKSGKFQFDQDGNIYIQPFQKLKIQPVKPNGYIAQWIITSDDGFKYTFSVMENTKLSTLCLDNSSSDVNYYGSCWYLSSIVSPSGSTVNFEYETGYEYNYQVSRFEHFGDLRSAADGYFGPAPQAKCTTTQWVQGVRLKKIYGTSDSIVFITGLNRADLPGDKYLDQIVIKNDAGTVIRKFNFDYNYMVGDQFSSVTTASGIDTENRLMLMSLQEVDASNIALKPSYDFSYIPGLPDRIKSNAIDFWGFYNGEITNTNLVPEDYYEGVYYHGACRLPSALHSAKGSLNRITYPTGGSTSFTYELNQADGGVRDYIQRSALMMFNNDPTGNYELPPVKFTVNSVNSPGAPVTFDASSVLPRVTSTCNLSVSVYRVNTDGSYGAMVFSSSGRNTSNSIETVWLTNGNYAIVSPPFHGCEPFVFTAAWKEFTGIPIFTVGGLRLKKMEDFDPVSGKKLVKNYQYTDASGKTSGRIISMPVFGYIFTQSWLGFLGEYYVRTATSSHQIGTNIGGFVGYGEVTVLHGETTTGTTTDMGIGGKTYYRFTSSGTNPDSNIVNGYPFSPSDSREWERGQLLEQIDYARQGQNYVSVKKLVNEYVFHHNPTANSNVRNSQGVKVAIAMNVPGGFNQLVWTYFNFYTGYTELTKTTEYLYDQGDPTKYSAKITNYAYSKDHLQPIKVETTDSDSRKTVNYISYPTDYADATGFIQDLKTANILKTPIEKVTYKTESDGSSVRILAGQIITYKTGGKGLQDAVYLLETADPIAIGNFRFSNRSSKNILPPSGTTAAFYIDPTIYKKRVSYDAYDSKGNLLQYSKDDFITSIIWGYNNYAPVAKVENASRGTDITTSSQIAYNGFEQGVSPGEYGWQNVVTANIVNRNTDATNVFAGRYAYKLNPGTTNGPTFNLIPSPQKGKYRLMCRIKTPSGYTANKAYLKLYTYKSGVCCSSFPTATSNNIVLNIPATNNNWQYFETIIDFEALRALSGSYNLILQALIANTDPNKEVYVDEIRIAPADAMMTTYTYDTLVGATSETQPNGAVTFYEYDTMGRLKNVKNQDGDIMNSYTYIYGNQ